MVAGFLDELRRKFRSTYILSDLFDADASDYQIYNL